MGELVCEFDPDLAVGTLANTLQASTIPHQMTTGWEVALSVALGREAFPTVYALDELLVCRNLP